jgi:hypothetical protein
MEYSADGNFDNSPIDNEITIAEKYYEVLIKPKKSEDPPLPPITDKTEFKTVRTDARLISDSSRFKQHYDTINFGFFDINLNKMKQEGYKTVSIYIQLNVCEIHDGYQHIMLYSSSIESNKYLLEECTFTHTPGVRDQTWRVHYENELKFENINIDNFMNNEFILRYRASGVGDDNWENKDLKIQLVFKK